MPGQVPRQPSLHLNESIQRHGHSEPSSSNDRDQARTGFDRNELGVVLSNQTIKGNEETGSSASLPVASRWERNQPDISPPAADTANFPDRQAEVPAVDVTPSVKAQVVQQKRSVVKLSGKSSLESITPPHNE